MRKRKRKRWRSRGSFLTSVLVVGAGTCMPAAFALVDGTAHLHTMSLSFIQTHGSALCWWMVGPGFRGLASLGPFLGAPAGCTGQVKFSGGTGSGAWHPLTPSWVPVRGASAPQIMETVEVVQHVPGGELIVVCQCHRSCRYVEVASLFGVLPQVQFFDKVVDMPVASLTGAWFLLEVPQIRSIARVRGPSSLHRDMWAFSEGLVMKGGRSSSHR